MDKSNYPRVGEHPSAPPLEPIQAPIETITQLGTASNYGQSTPDQPPPSYQEAVNYPPAPPYPNYEPNNFPMPNQPIAQHHYNSTQHSNAPPATTIYVTPTQPTTHIHHTTMVPPIRRNGCSFCHGTVESETDICCLICLILLAIFTFPFGLVLLFCIPCTVRKRCNGCRRLYD